MRLFVFVFLLVGSAAAAPQSKIRNEDAEDAEARISLEPIFTKIKELSDVIKMKIVGVWKKSKDLPIISNIIGILSKNEFLIGKDDRINFAIIGAFMESLNVDSLEQALEYAETALQGIAGQKFVKSIADGLITSFVEELPSDTIEELLDLVPWDKLDNTIENMDEIDIDTILEVIESFKPLFNALLEELTSNEENLVDVIQDAISSVDDLLEGRERSEELIAFENLAREAENMLTNLADAMTNNHLRHFTQQLTKKIVNTPVIKRVLGESGARCTGARATAPMKVVCYYPNWVYYRKGAGKFTVDEIDTSLCTHIIYSFVVLDNEKHVIKVHDTWLDSDKPINLGNFRKFTDLKKTNPNAKYMVALGGWNDSKRSKYSELLASPDKIAKFVEHAIGFLTEYGFDGLDLDYEYPSYDGHGRDAPDSDKPGFTLLCKKLSEAFKDHGWELTAAVSASESVIANAYEIPKISMYLDAIHMMSYDMHGSWEKMVNHHSPLYGADWDKLTTDYGANYWVSQGCPKHKLIVGIPTYGRSWTLGGWDSTKWEYDINSTARDAGKAGPLTKAKGFLAYNEICQFVKNEGWTKVTDPTNQMGPYAYKENQWVGYDDPAIASVKAQYIVEKQFGGAMFWDLPSDDFGNLCGDGKYPIIGAVSKIVKRARTCASVPLIAPADEVYARNPADTLTNNNLREFNYQTLDQTQALDLILPEKAAESRCAGARNTAPMKVVCYYPNWVYYRKGAGKFTVDEIDTSLCTHIIYSFVILDNENHVIKVHDSWLDMDKPVNPGNFRKFTDLKKTNPNAKYMIALGGWNDSKKSKYSKLLASPDKIAKFVEHAIGFLKEYGFDGLDLDYEYPSYDGHGRDAPDSDKPGFTLLCKKLSEAFKEHGYELTAAVSASESVIANAYEIPKISMYLDAIHMMSYDMHGSWEKMVNHHSPLYGSDWDKLTTDYGANYWVSQGCPKHKLIVGIPTYGRSWTLGGWDSTKWEYDINSTARDGGKAGPLTKAKGFLAYNEICQFVKNEGWTKVTDPTNKMGPYAYKGNQWVGYDDPAIASVKAQYIVDNQFGGAMFWDLPSDDFSNLCGDGKYPIIRAVSKIVKRARTCASVPLIAPAAEVDARNPADTLTNNNLREFNYQTLDQTQALDFTLPEKAAETRCAGARNTAPMKVVCYYPNWVYYRKGAGKFTVDEIDTSLCTHIIYSFVVLDNEKHVIKVHDSWLDMDKPINLGNFRKFTDLKKTNPNAKYMIALGGWNDSKRSKYSELLASPNKIAKFVEHAISFLKDYGFDGLDLDYEYPSYDGHGRDAPDSDKPGFTLLCKKLSEAFKEHGWELTAAVSASQSVISNAYEIPKISMYLDAIHMMSYDMHGSWEKMVNHHSPLYGNDWDKLTTDYAANYWVSQGCPKHKLIVGIPTYGRSWTLGGWDSTKWEYDINSTARDAGEAGPLTKAKGFLAYNEICQFVKNEGWTKINDPTNKMGPYAFKGNQWVGYDDPAIARVKAQYIVDNQFGGAMFWDLPSDDFSNLCGDGKYPIIGAVSKIVKKARTCRAAEVPAKAKETPRSFFNLVQDSWPFISQ